MKFTSVLLFKFRTIVGFQNDFDVLNVEFYGNLFCAKFCGFFREKTGPTVVRLGN